MTKPRVAIVGAGLCGSVLAARLRNAFDVKVVEQSRRSRPLYDDVECAGGGVTTTINRAAGLGGTTNYWHNGLIELGSENLRACGLDPAEFSRLYQRAWSLFLSDSQLAAFNAIRDENASAFASRAKAHMVVPQTRRNVWGLATQTWAGDPVNVVYGHADRLVRGDRGDVRHLAVRTESGDLEVVADHYIFSAGGLVTPSLLAASFRPGGAFCGGYHDHPMAYLAKLRLRPDSVLKRVSCVETDTHSVRTGMVYEANGLRAVFYLRPALDLNTASIIGEARYILSDLRNDPFSPKKILQLLRNVEALREAVLFKTRAGFLGDYYSVLMLGEQKPSSNRGVNCIPGRRPVLNWHVTAEEQSAYHMCFEQFLAEISAEVVDRNLIPSGNWEFRTSAHHSGTASNFTSGTGDGRFGLFAVPDVPNVFVCDASNLRSGGVANSGLTLVALSHQLADAMIAEFAGPG